MILIDADALGRQRTGNETYIRELLRELAGRAGDLHLAAVTRHPALVPEGIEPVELQAQHQLVRMSVQLPRLLRRLRPRVAHFQHALPLGYSGPSVVTVHDLSFERDPGLMRPRDRLVFRTAVPRSARRASRVIVVSERTKRDLIELAGVPAERIRVVPNGVGEPFGPEGPHANGQPYALVVGSLEPRKDPLTAVEGFALLGSDELRLVFAGPDRGDGEAARAAAARRGLEQRVDFKGHVSGDELAALYRGAACLVFPSRDEGFGLPLLEAMASGVPVVATRAGALPEIAGDAAILVEPGDPVALAGGIERALADRERLVAAGFDRAKQFSWAETAEKTLAVYRELL
ncbi:MAG TPA: glycosyltransferase family 1 protein [Gaiellaceae bacterium]